MVSSADDQFHVFVCRCCSSWIRAKAELMLLQSSFWLLKLLILILSCSLPAITSFSGLQSEEPLLHSFAPSFLHSFASLLLRSFTPLQGCKCCSKGDRQWLLSSSHFTQTSISDDEEELAAPAREAETFDGDKQRRLSRGHSQLTTS